MLKEERFSSKEVDPTGLAKLVAFDMLFGLNEKT